MLARTLSLALPLLVPAPGAPAADALPPKDAAEITGFVQDTFDQLGLVPGLALAVVRGDRVVLARGFGHADLERRRPVTPATVFYTASLAKAFTGTTAAVLAAQGRLDLDAPLARHYPGLRFEASVSSEQATVRGLLRHAPGFENGAINFVSTWVGRYPEPELLRVLGRYSEARPNRFEYANTNYALAGWAMEKATGEPWQDLMARLVFEPLGMRASTARLAAVDQDAMAQPYVSTAAGLRRLSALVKSDDTITGAGGIFSTAEDLARFVVANLNGGRLDGRPALPAEAVRAAHTSQIGLDATFYEFHRKAYGLGFYIADYDGERLVHHFGGFPGYRSHVSFMPERGLGVVVLQNEGGAGSRFADLVATYVYDRLRGREEVAARARRRLGELREAAARGHGERAEWEGRVQALRNKPVAPSLAPAAYAGAYRSDRLGELRVTSGPAGLRVAYGRLDGPLVATGGHEFLADWTPGSEPDTVRFVADDGSRVLEMRWDDRPFARVTDQGRRR